MGVSYDAIGSELVTESATGLWKAGKRCPELFLKKPGDDQTIRLYSMLNYGKYLLLSIGGSDKHGLHGKLSGLVTDLTLLAPGSVSKNSDDGVFISETINSDDNMVVVVRPDMYIGFVGNDWQDYMAQIFKF